ncbi:tRNA1(Val) (adenine(37)-N6)-methyltransferase [Shewanella gelidii]|uniref:tRNA1(Val) (adenine(37)-N6)-methyltransferase n=1 Tax=Shewanella gelidii TaxID=1642821 RepID=A0A917K0I1_9GAMM|nr:methyltransferase [Shewanella gelidii]MCL1099328.1 methyltransferase [Shewanella gelidii]GGI92023.1 tRNA1(Val) (adenine(37)-N6)-methyltransferase [Shewanella gelidii]
MPFTFKQFHVDDRRCGMPVSTDGVLLGAWADLSQAKRILDIGAGSGLLSLMAAQRSLATIDAVEIDAFAAQASQLNFTASPWSHRLSIHHTGILDYTAQYLTSDVAVLYDHIICNPPYFESGPRADCNSRAQARHTQQLDFKTLMQCIQKLLATSAMASLILPQASLDKVLIEANLVGLGLTHKTDIVGVVGKPSKLVMIALGHQPLETTQLHSRLNSVNRAAYTNQLTVRDQQNRYTQEMVALTQEFYLAM